MKRTRCQSGEVDGKRVGGDDVVAAADDDDGRGSGELLTGEDVTAEEVFLPGPRLKRPVVHSSRRLIGCVLCAVPQRRC